MRNMHAWYVMNIRHTCNSWLMYMSLHSNILCLWGTCMMSHVHVSHGPRRSSFHSYVCHDSFICVPWLIDMCAMTHTYVCHDSFICVPWLIHMCVMTRSYVPYAYLWILGLGRQDFLIFFRFRANSLTRAHTLILSYTHSHAYSLALIRRRARAHTPQVRS